MTRNINTLEHVQYSVNRHQQERECFLQTPSFIFPIIFYAIETVMFIQGTCTSPVRGRLFFFLYKICAKSTTWGLHHTPVPSNGLWKGLKALKLSTFILSSYKTYTAFWEKNKRVTFICYYSLLLLHFYIYDFTISNRFSYYWVTNNKENLNKNTKYYFQIAYLRTLYTDFVLFQYEQKRTIKLALDN